MTFTVTDEMTPDSSAVQDAYYNEETKDLYVILTGGTGYRYSDVPFNVWGWFKSAGSKGEYYAKTIKRQYGPGDNLGHTNDWEFDVVAPKAPDMGPVLTIKGNAATTLSSNTISINADSWKPVRKHTVKFNSGISDREYSVEVKSVEEAVQDLMRIAEILGLTGEIKVKEVVTHFE
jgi:hypothetical protein